MAASVLGKRQRHSTISEDASAPIRTRKRRALDATPTIYSDDHGVPKLHKLQTHQDAASPMDLDDLQHKVQGAIHQSSTRNVPLNHTVRNKQPTIIGKKASVIIRLSGTVADENVPPFEFKTPTTNRFKDALSNAAPKTPKHRVRLVGKPLTPRTPRTLSTPPSKPQTIYALARDLFTSSTSPRKLVGRDSERQELLSFVSNAANSETGGCTYISGPPGTGKSALIEEISAEWKADPSMQVAYVNCVGIKNAKDVYVKLVEDLCSDEAPISGLEKDHLRSLFIPKKKSGSSAYLVLLDEIDSLLDSDCDVLYSLFEWALHRGSRLILIGIANALDLTDRFLPRLKARNLQPRLLPFLPYTATQIATIITDLLRSTLLVESAAPPDFVPFLHPTAIQLSSKKVASQNGDLRRAFSLVRRVIDQVERETLEKCTVSSNSNVTKQPLAEISNVATKFPPTPPMSSPLKPTSPQAIYGTSTLTALTPETAPRATVAHVARLASSIFSHGTAARLAGLNLQQKAVLCSLIAAEKKKTTRDPFSTPTKSGNKAPTVKDLYVKYAGLCTRDEGVLHPLKSTEFRDVVASLETLGLVHDSIGRTTGFLTPTKTPTRVGKHPDERQIVSGVSEKEMSDSLTGAGGAAGADLLQRLMDE